MRGFLHRFLLVAFLGFEFFARSEVSNIIPLNLVSDALNGEVWKLEGERFTLSPRQAESNSRREWNVKLGRSETHKRTVIWSGFNLEAAPHLKIIVTVKVKGKTSEWHLRVENPGSLQVNKIRFPRIANIPEQKNEFLAVPEWMGQLAANPRAMLTNNARWEWDYPGRMSLQCLALYPQDGSGFYFSCDDVKAYRKSFALMKDAEGRLGYEMVHLVERGAAEGKRYDIPYAAIIGTFRGDWFTAAERYRSWGTNQIWARTSRLQKKLVPEWVLQTGMWVWNRGRSPNVLEPAKILQKQLGLPVSVFWHWWHGCAYDTGFPEYLPPREGMESFTNALTTARKDGIHGIVYMNQRLWGMTTASWKAENAAPFAVKGEDGKIRPEVYNTFTKLPCASMCMGTEFWRSKYAGLAAAAVKDLGVDGIYMDQACSSLSCFDASHGHAVGGGRYWMQGFQKLSTDIRIRAEQPVALGGEGCGEAWLPYLDVMLTLQVSKERYAGKDGWEPIPFFQAVYHPYAVFYGNYSSLTMPPYDDLWPKEFAPKEPLKLLDRKYSEQFRLEQARAWAWGLEPTIANFMGAQLQERKEETDFMMRLAKLRMAGLKYFLRGALLRSPDLKTEKKTLEMSRLSIYAGQHGGLKSFQMAYATTLASAWRAPDGDVCVALVNADEAGVSVALDLARKEYELPKKGEIYRVDEKSRRLIGNFDSDVKLPVELAGGQACMIEFTKK